MSAFVPSRVTREQLVQRSVFDYIKAALEARQYPDGQIEYKESFQTDLFTDSGIDKTYICSGFHMNDGGKLAELGSNLRQKNYQFEYWVVGLTQAQGETIAHAIAEAVEQDLTIPLLDYTQAGNPEIGNLLAAENPVRVARIGVPDPAPWQEFLFTVTVEVTDWYYL